MPEMEFHAEEVLIFQPPDKSLRNTPEHVREEEEIRTHWMPAEIPYHEAHHMTDDAVDLKPLFPNRVYGLSLIHI